MASEYKGMSRQANGDWRACIHIGGKKVNFGTFKDAALAAKAVDRCVCRLECVVTSPLTPASHRAQRRVQAEGRRQRCQLRAPDAG
jgi:hypothetical protein